MGWLVGPGRTTVACGWAGTTEPVGTDEAEMGVVMVVRADGDGVDAPPVDGEITLGEELDGEMGTSQQVVPVVLDGSHASEAGNPKSHVRQTRRRSAVTPTAAVRVQISRRA